MLASPAGALVSAASVLASPAGVFVSPAGALGSAASVLASAAGVLVPGAGLLASAVGVLVPAAGMGISAKCVSDTAVVPHEEGSAPPSDASEQPSRDGDPVPQREGRAHHQQVPLVVSGVALGEEADVGISECLVELLAAVTLRLTLPHVSADSDRHDLPALPSRTPSC